MITKWDTISTKRIAGLKIFSADMVTRRQSVWNKESDFVVLNSPAWVNIIPVTKDNNVVMIEQFRHGINDITLEVPGGLIEQDEQPRIAGQRECTEETGFASESNAILLGENLPNPAFLNNTCYSYLWLGCEKIAGQSLDSNEDIEVIEVPLNKIEEYIITGKIKHSLVLTAFLFYKIKYGL